MNYKETPTHTHFAYQSVFNLKRFCRIFPKKGGRYYIKYLMQLTLLKSLWLSFVLDFVLQEAHAAQVRRNKEVQSDYSG